MQGCTSKTARELEGSFCCSHVCFEEGEEAKAASDEINPRHDANDPHCGGIQLFQVPRHLASLAKPACPHKKFLQSSSQQTSRIASIDKQQAFFALLPPQMPTHPQPIMEILIRQMPPPLDLPYGG
jgi:hypothetical protein